MSLKRKPRKLSENPLYKALTAKSDERTDGLRTENSEMEQQVINHYQEMDQILNPKNTTAKQNMEYLKRLDQYDERKPKEELPKTSLVASDEKDSSTYLSNSSQENKVSSSTETEYDKMMRKLASHQEKQAPSITQTSYTTYDDIMRNSTISQEKQSSEQVAYADYDTMMNKLENPQRNQTLTSAQMSSSTQTAYDDMMRKLATSQKAQTSSMPMSSSAQMAYDDMMKGLLKAGAIQQPEEKSSNHTK